MDQMLGNFIPALVEVPMGPGRNMNIIARTESNQRPPAYQRRLQDTALNGALFPPIHIQRFIRYRWSIIHRWPSTGLWENEDGL